MNKIHSIVMLPTNEKATGIVMLKKSTNKLVTDFHSTRNTTDHFAQELYILSNEEIKEGDWYINNGVIFRSDDKFDKGNNPNQNKDNKKIIATTDTDLKVKIKYRTHISIKLLPQIPQSFIEYFVSEYTKGNIITEVMVEYEEKDVPYESELKVASDGGYYSKPSSYIRIESLKINLKDNTITIRKIKDSWSREEVIALLNKMGNDLKGHHSEATKEYTNWIEQNL